MIAGDKGAPGHPGPPGPPGITYNFAEGDDMPPGLGSKWQDFYWRRFDFDYKNPFIS